MNIITTLLSKSFGDVMVNGYELDRNDNEIRNSIGVVFQNKMLDDFLTVRENLISRGRMYGLSRQSLEDRITDLSLKLDANDILDKRYARLSGGQQRKADMIRALIHMPKILILDEPTTGLDPYTRQKVWDVIAALRAERNLTIFLTTHYMEEAMQSDYIVIIDQGLIKAQGTPETLRLNYSYDRLVLIPKDEKEIISQLNQSNITYTMDKEKIIIALPHSLEALPILQKVKSNINSFEVIRGCMDDVFINITKEER